MHKTHSYIIAINGKVSSITIMKVIQQNLMQLYLTNLTVEINETVIRITTTEVIQ